MNFEEWFSKTFGESDYVIKGASRNGWNGCKEEVLKILDKHKKDKISPGIEGEDDIRFNYIDDEVIKEIEKSV
ncbi:MAG: hypothetical protein AABY22_19195 [Nanoarchaeota archaeon]